MYQLAITRDFIAQHYLVGGDWGTENQKHSHHYRVEINIESDQLDQHGYLIDIVDLDQAVSNIVAEFQDKTLNELAPFANLNPSLERFAKIFFDALKKQLNLQHHCLTIKLWENDNDWAAYQESTPIT